MKKMSIKNCAKTEFNEWKEKHWRCHTSEPHHCSPRPFTLVPRLGSGVGNFILAKRAIKVAYVKMYFLKSNTVFLTVIHPIILAVIYVVFDFIKHDFLKSMFYSE